QVNIQAVLPGQLELLASLARQAYLDHFTYLWHDEGAWYSKYSFASGTLEKEMAEDNNRFFMAWLNAFPVGFLKLRLDQPLGEIPGSRAMELERIYLLSSATGKGIGKALLRHAETMARQYRKEILWLKAMDSSQEAIAFYQRNGFNICGSHRLDSPVMKEEYRGMLILEKTLE
ncbi:MAG TPA: GNAT family N-acetyltransferase, partial [Puia sp.]|nr:GNAT family N-acetyltransferase [Puia sp.]